MDNNSLLLNTVYNAPIGCFAEIIATDKIYIEANENYIKQSYRNRCEIYGANGKLTLSIPVKKISGEKMNIRDVRIDNSSSWKRIHVTSIKSAYNSSPFFEYYADEIFTIIINQYKYLFDLNFVLLTSIMSLLDIQKDINLTENYSFNNEFTGKDLRDFFHPKKILDSTDNKMSEMTYHQVFNEKHGFIPHLSILDLIFNCGPRSEEYLINYSKIVGSIYKSTSY